jgi:hypothetical protein
MRAVRVLVWRSVAVLLFVVGCGVRTPARVDVAAMIAKRGAIEARRDLTIRVLADPRDVQARLALAELDERTGRPSEAIDQLEAVLKLGGPLGTRWRDDDRARLGRLLLARARARLARGAITALGDLERARSFGAVASAQELDDARIAIAVAQLRHTDAKERAQGRATLAAHAGSARPNTSAWSGANPSASPAQRGAFGAWLWTVGARRAAYDELTAWHAATKAPRDDKLQAVYLRALAWWSPLWLGEVKPPPAEDLVGPERCWFPGTDCDPPASDEPPPAAAPALDADPRAAVAARYAVARVSAGAWLSRGSADARPLVDVSALLQIASAFARNPAIAERLGRDFVASSVDAALAHATLGALFDALADPARARAGWQAAVDASPEALFVRGLAETVARGGDSSAALVFATQAAAASGDPAVVWAAVARALARAGQQADALTASRSALDLAGPEVLPAALDVAIAASRALGRNAQADALAVQRAQVAPRTKADDAEAQLALAAHREQPTASTIARLWVASRAYPGSVELRAALLDALDADDPRLATVTAELIALAGDPDAERAFAAVTALGRRR